jgi:hypothetical protein
VFWKAVCHLQHYFRREGGWGDTKDIPNLKIKRKGLIGLLSWDIY